MKFLCICVLLSAIACKADGGVFPENKLHNSIENDPQTVNDDRIVGGVEANVNEFPHQLSLQHRTNHFCGAVILNENWAVTAAHCVLQYQASDMSIVAGEHNLQVTSSQEQRRTLSRVVIHEAYNIYTQVNDIALLEWTSPLTFDTGVNKIDYLEFNQGLTSSVTATVTGWGTQSSGGSVSAILRKVSVPTLIDADCRKTGYDAALIKDDMICAGLPEGGKDSCQGDSGGPLIADLPGLGKRLIGIVSFGNDCAKPNFPGVYTEVSRYANWIKANAV